MVVKNGWKGGRSGFSQINRMDIEVRGNVFRLGWLLEVQKINFKDSLRGVNQQVLLRQCFVVCVIGWMVVLVFQILLERGCILGEENLGIDYELRFRFVYFERYLKCLRENVRWVVVDILG